MAARFTTVRDYSMMTAGTESACRSGDGADSGFGLTNTRNTRWTWLAGVVAPSPFPLITRACGSSDWSSSISSCTIIWLVRAWNRGLLPLPSWSSFACVRASASISLITAGSSGGSPVGPALRRQSSVAGVRLTKVFTAFEWSRLEWRAVDAYTCAEYGAERLLRSRR
jgi:hypothetical protein